MSDKFEFIDAEYADNKAANNKNAPSIVKMCRWLGVGRSSFNEWVCHERRRGLDVGRAS